jgi:hypothetical protein
MGNSTAKNIKLTVKIVKSDKRTEDANGGVVHEGNVQDVDYKLEADVFQGDPMKALGLNNGQSAANHQV